MEDIGFGRLYRKLSNKEKHYSWVGYLELTYRCNLNCIHCYIKGSEDKNRELTTEEWKKNLDVLQKEGCLILCFTGGDPLIRDDFLEIYSYAKAKGFIIVFFTNGQALTAKIIDYLVKSPPYSIEITLNGITKKTYESITQIPGSFLKVMKTINMLKEKKLHFILKTNCLKQNKHEMGRIKAFIEKLYAKLPGNKYYFGFDHLINPRLDCDKTPCNYRLSFKELLEVIKQDPIWKGYQEALPSDFPKLEREKNFLHQCNTRFDKFFITPYGRLKCCPFSERFSIDLKTTPLKEGFYKVFPKHFNEKFKTNSKCQDCSLRPICHWCPGRAYLETGNQEAPIPYYCELAKATAEQMRNRVSVIGQKPKTEH